MGGVCEKILKKQKKLLPIHRTERRKWYYLILKIIKNTDFDYITWEQRKFEDIAVRSSSISSESGLPRVEYEDITKFIRVRLYVFCFNS